MFFLVQAIAYTVFKNSTKI